MALNSPGVEVQVIDESFYTPAGAGTVPMLFVATSSNKSNPSGTGTATGTLDSNIGKVYTITSQRDLTDTFGTPLFETDSNQNPVHGGELNEYGLQAAYSALGVTSKVYVARAAVDLSQLTPTASTPTGNPVSGTYWLDSDTSRYGVGEWDAVNQLFVNKTPLVIDDSNADTTLDAGLPKASLGSKGGYAIVIYNYEIKLYFKNTSNAWVLVGTNTETNFGSAISGSTFGSTSWQSSWPVVAGTVATANTGSIFTINGHDVTLGANVTAIGVATSINSLLPQYGVGAKANGSMVELYADVTSEAYTADPTATAHAVLELSTYAVTAGGLNYLVNDLIVVNGGTGDFLTEFKVATVGTTGTITSLILNPGNPVARGEYTVLPPRPTTVQTNGTGSGVALTIDFKIKALEVDAAGNDYTQAPAVTISGNATANAVLTGPSVTSFVITSAGSGYITAPTVSIAPAVSGHGKIRLLDVTGGTLASLGFTAGLYGNVAISIQPHTQYPQYATNKNATGSVYVKTTSPDMGASLLLKYFDGVTESWVTVPAPMFGDAPTAIKSLDTSGGKNIAAGSIFVESNYDHGTGASTSTVKLAEFKIYRRATIGATTISKVLTATTITTSTFQINETVIGSASYVNTATVTIAAGPIENFASAVSAAGLTNVEATYNATTQILTLSHKLGGEFKLLDGTNLPLATLGFTTNTTNLYATGVYEPDGFTLRASNWKPLTYSASYDVPTQTPDDGSLWYSSSYTDIDIMVHNGSTWVGYRNYNHGDGVGATAPLGPIISATMPAYQHDGVTDLANGDIWISTADMELYGQNISVWSSSLSKWILQDVTDQTSPTGWVFADARWATAGSSTEPAAITQLLLSDYLDPDAPEPAEYPQGMKLWNLRRSGFNVKKYLTDYLNLSANDGTNLRYNDEDMAGYAADRWVSVSPNNENGSGAFGRHAQRGLVVKELKSLIDTNVAIRDTDTLTCNLIATPGYSEVIANMVSYNLDRGQTALVIGDTPFRLKANGTDLAAWGTNANLALDNGDAGAVTYDEYLAMFYPSGYTSDNLGNYIVVPPSHMMLRTIITSDQKSYQWFAPAGIRRGGVDNATSVGYLVNGEFQVAPLPQNLRDVMIQTAKINPIATLPGAGLVNFGNLTRAKAASSLDRINVARLVCYLRRQLDILARPFLFEPNDRITRNEIKGSVESFLLELVGQRALYDFIVVCDESNNTPSRIDQNQLWVDIAVEPVKSVEFIYLPLRLKKTGSIAAL